MIPIFRKVQRKHSVRLKERQEGVFELPRNRKNTPSALHSCIIDFAQPPCYTALIYFNGTLSKIAVFSIGIYFVATQLYAAGK